MARKTLNHEIAFNEIPCSLYGLSTRGWMDLEWFSKWFTDCFLSYAPATRPVLLQMDGHKSHYCPDMIKLAARKGVILFALPPHTTHLCQPLDKVPFAPLKIEWRKAVHKFLTSNKGREVTVYDFNTVFSEAWYGAMTAANVIAGFRCAGVFPFNRNAVKVRTRNLILILLLKTLRLTTFPFSALADQGPIVYLMTLLNKLSEDIDSPLRSTGIRRSVSEGTLNQCPTLSAIRPKSLREFLKTPLAPKRSRGRGPTYFS